MIEQSKTGWIYQHGYSKDGSSIVWYRPGLLRKVVNPELYIRTIIFTLEYAVVESFIRSSGSAGRYNVVIDCENFSFSSVPSFGQVRKLVTILQDHFPHRTSFIFLVNLAPTAQLFLKMIRPLLSEVGCCQPYCWLYLFSACVNEDYYFVITRRSRFLWLLFPYLTESESKNTYYSNKRGREKIGSAGIH